MRSCLILRVGKRLGQNWTICNLEVATVLGPRGSLNLCGYARILRTRQKVHSRAVQIVTIIFSKISLVLYAVSHLLLTLL